ncbi:MAG: Type 1 glutamine amidotransferase-like domain-containing protein [Candidatus Saccharibacteria bacterium]
MSIKYIIHGGNAQDKNEANAKFFREILSDFTDDANILLVQFAAVPEKQDVYKTRHISQFEDVSNGRKLNFQVAEVDKFIEQVKWANVLYLCGSSGGGATLRLLNTMRNFGNLKELFEGKTIAGESAGANTLTTFCYSKSGGIVHGLGLVPVKSIVHYEQGDEKFLEYIDESLESAYLKSYQYKVYN